MRVKKLRNWIWIYWQTVNEGRPRPEEIIGNAKINTKLRNYRAFNAVSVSRGCHMVPTVQLKARFTETSLCPER